MLHLKNNLYIFYTSHAVQMWKTSYQHIARTDQLTDNTWQHETYLFEQNWMDRRKQQWGWW